MLSYLSGNMDDMMICGLAEIGNKQKRQERKQDRQQKRQDKREERQEKRQQKRGGGPGGNPIEEEQTPTPSPAPPPQPGGTRSKLTLPPMPTLPVQTRRADTGAPQKAATQAPIDQRRFVEETAVVQQRATAPKEPAYTEGAPGTAERTGAGGIGEMLSNPLVLGGLALAVFLILKREN